jgi:hypothetical protein
MDEALAEGHVVVDAVTFCSALSNPLRKKFPCAVAEPEMRRSPEPIQQRMVHGVFQVQYWSSPGLESRLAVYILN